MDLTNPSPRVSIVVARRPDATSDAVGAALGAATDELRAAGWAAHAAVAIEPDPFLDLPHGAEVPARVGGLLSIDLTATPPGADLGAALRGVSARLTGVVDLQRSGLIRGVEHAVIEGDGPLHISFVLRRNPAMSHAEFSDYWLNHHGKLAREAPRRKSGTGYRQLHADPDASRELAAAVGIGRADYDGIVSSDHVEVERMKRIFSHPAVAETALGDERHFIDHRHSAIGLLQGLARVTA